MQTNVKIFGQLVDIVAKDELHVTGNDLHELLENLKSLYPALATSRYAVALNKKIITSNSLLQAGDEVALLPPFSGG